MDVCGIFLGDTNLSYGSMRNSVYRDYEQFPYGTLENCKTPIIKDSYSRVQEKCQQNRIEKTGKQTCPFCKEHKKRPLISYLRKKNYINNHEKICEEIEEEPQEEIVENNEDNDDAQKHQHHHHLHHHHHQKPKEQKLETKSKQAAAASLVVEEVNDPKIIECNFGPKKNIQI